MKALFYSIFIFFFHLSVNAQYQVGVPVYDTIYSGTFYRIDDCSPEEDVNIELDEALLNFVAGIELIMIIDEVNIPEGNISTSSGIILANDSLEFNNNTSFYPFFFSGEGDFKFSIIAKGMPLIENQMYPCFFTGLVTQAHCKNGYIITPDLLFENCRVQEEITTNTNEVLKEDRQLDLFPNPASSFVNIEFSDAITSIQSLEVFRSTGSRVYFQQNISPNENLILDTSNFNSGVYYLKISSNKQSLLKTFIIN